LIIQTILPGVWLVLGLVGMLYVDQTPLSDGLKSVVRVSLLVAPILVSLGFSCRCSPRRRSGPTASST
jgi:hypothetical protein